MHMAYKFILQQAGVPNENGNNFFLYNMAIEPDWEFPDSGRYAEAIWQGLFCMCYGPPASQIEGGTAYGFYNHY
jgi:hypothetical protein